MKKRIAILAVAVVGSLALAQSVMQLDLNISDRISAITKGLLIGPLSVHNSNTAILKNNITRAIGASATLDFTYDAGCQNLTIGVVGVRTNDACSVGLPASGGAASSAFTCYASDAGEVTVRQCPAGADPASATYKVRLLSNTAN